MASPTSAIEPVTTTARFGASAAHARASSRASSSRSTACTPVGADAGGDDRRERRRTSRARSELGPRDEERAARPGEDGDDAVGVLVGQHAEHEDDLVEVEVLVERRDERLGAVRVVRGIDDHRRVGGDRLQPARRGRGGEALVHDLVGETHRIRRR